MIAAAALALLLVQAPAQAAPPAAASTATPTPVSPVVVPAAPAAPAAPDPEKIAADLAMVYEQSCGGRIYGMYADACNNLSAQLAKAQAEARRAAKVKARNAAAAH